MIEAAERDGKIHPGKTVLIEPTSGNTGIARAFVADVNGYELILTIPETMSLERRVLMLAFGAKIVLTPGPNGMKGTVVRAQRASTGGFASSVSVSVGFDARRKIQACKNEHDEQQPPGRLGYSLDVTSRLEQACTPAHPQRGWSRDHSQDLRIRAQRRSRSRVMCSTSSGRRWRKRACFSK